MTVQTRPLRPVDYERRYSGTRQPHFRSFAYPDTIEAFAPVHRYSQLPPAVASRKPRYSVEPAPVLPPTKTDWKKLPPSILSLILAHLRSSHLSPRTQSCSTCYIRDLCAVQATCKTWFSDAQRTLYTHIQINGKDDPDMLHKWKLSRAARLIRLRSTLRSRPLLANLVKTLHVPDPNVPLYLQEGDPNPQYDAYICTVASLVMTCPNLEALTGFYPFYNHMFDRLTHALSTRQHLREHVWIVSENEDVELRSQIQLPPGLLDEHQVYQFKLYHVRWQNLETLMFCSPGGAGVIEHELFIQVLHSLPALKQLCISSFDADDFHNTTLLSLPRQVTSLRIEECPGVTDAGLTRWAAKPNAAQIKCLCLVHQTITSLLTLSKLLTSLDHLQKFTIVQRDMMPSLPNGRGPVLVQPILASKSLEFLHWDLSAQQTEEPSLDVSTFDHNDPTPNMCLAMSISHRGFPKLARLRAPQDTSPLGILQSACQPLSDLVGPSDEDFSPQHYQKMRQSNSLRAARFRARRIRAHSGLSHDLRSGERSGSQTPTNNRLTVPQQPQKTNSETSTSTVGSQETGISYASTRSTNSWDRPRGSLELVSPLSTSQDDFSQLAPDDGVISPIGPEDDRSRLPSRRWRKGKGKQVAFAPEPTGTISRASSSSKSGSICQCSPGMTGNRDSVCLCEVHGNPGVAMRVPATVISRVSVRRKPVPPTRNPTRFPSLAVRPNRTGRPIFYLEPDVPGREANGGLIGWAELLGIKEKARMSIAEQSQTGSTSPVTRLSGDTKASGKLTPKEEKRQKNLCRGIGDDDDSDEDALGELPVLKKILSGASTTSQDSTLKRSRSKSKSGSKLSLSLGARLSEKDKLSSTRTQKHVARPRGDRGGCVTVNDFF